MKLRRSTFSANTKGLSKSPFEINLPKDRWKPDIDGDKTNDQQYYAPFVERIREEIFEWRQFGYDGVSETSKSLLNYWFSTFQENGFRYYFGQRESVESIIFLYERLKIRENRFIEVRFLGLSKNFINDKWLRFVLKQATGTGKTKVLMLLITWPYFHKKFETQSTLSKNFLLISPNTIVLDRLKKILMVEFSRGPYYSFQRLFW